MSHTSAFGRTLRAAGGLYVLTAIMLTACSSSSSSADAGTEDGGTTQTTCKGDDCKACLETCGRIESDRCLPLYTNCEKTCGSVTAAARDTFVTCGASKTGTDCAESECYYGLPGAPRLAPARTYDLCVSNCKRLGQADGLACLIDEGELKCKQACQNGTIDKINAFNGCMTKWNDLCPIGKGCYDGLVAP